MKTLLLLALWFGWVQAARGGASVLHVESFVASDVGQRLVTLPRAVDVSRTLVASISYRPFPSPACTLLTGRLISSTELRIRRGGSNGCDELQFSVFLVEFDEVSGVRVTRNFDSGFFFDIVANGSPNGVTNEVGSTFFLEDSDARPIDLSRDFLWSPWWAVLCSQDNMVSSEDCPLSSSGGSATCCWGDGDFLRSRLTDDGVQVWSGQRRSFERVALEIQVVQFPADSIQSLDRFDITLPAASTSEKKTFSIGAVPSERSLQLCSYSTRSLFENRWGWAPQDIASHTLTSQLVYDDGAFSANIVLQRDGTSAQTNVVASCQLVVFTAATLVSVYRQQIYFDADDGEDFHSPNVPQSHAIDRALPLVGTRGHLGRQRYENGGPRQRNRPGSSMYTVLITQQPDQVVSQRVPGGGDGGFVGVQSFAPIQVVFFPVALTLAPSAAPTSTLPTGMVPAATTVMPPPDTRREPTPEPTSMPTPLPETSAGQHAQSTGNSVATAPSDVSISSSASVSTAGDMVVVPSVSPSSSSWIVYVVVGVVSLCVVLMLGLVALWRCRKVAPSTPTQRQLQRGGSARSLATHYASAARPTTVGRTVSQRARLSPHARTSGSSSGSGGTRRSRRHSTKISSRSSDYASVVMPEPSAGSEQYSAAHFPQTRGGPMALAKTYGMPAPASQIPNNAHYQTVGSPLDPHADFNSYTPNYSALELK